jgi:hypothetical protein
MAMELILSLPEEDLISQSLFQVISSHAKALLLVNGNPFHVSGAVSQL